MSLAGCGLPVGVPVLGGASRRVGTDMLLWRCVLTRGWAGVCRVLECWPGGAWADLCVLWGRVEGGLRWMSGCWVSALGVGGGCGGGDVEMYVGLMHDGCVVS